MRRKHFGISAPCQIIANACASGTNAIGHAFECVRSGRYERVLTGGYDAISELVFVGLRFAAGRDAGKMPAVRSRSHRHGARRRRGRSRPRKFEAARKRGAKSWRKSSATGFRPTIIISRNPNPSGSRSATGDGSGAAKRGMCRRAKSTTSTRTAPPRRSTMPPKAKQSQNFSTACRSVRPKSMMGHSLGAAGAIEAVICLLALQGSISSAEH